MSYSGCILCSRLSFCCRLLLIRSMCFLSPCFPVLCQSCNFMILDSLCPLQQVINACTSSSSTCFLSFRFSFQRQQNIWTTGTLQSMSSVCQFLPHNVVLGTFDSLMIVIQPMVTVTGLPILLIFVEASQFEADISIVWFGNENALFNMSWKGLLFLQTRN